MRLTMAAAAIWTLAACAPLALAADDKPEPPAPQPADGPRLVFLVTDDPDNYQAATVLLNGEVKGKTEPVAWTRMAGKSRVFYTSLGHPDDFKNPAFLAIVINGIHWALGRDASGSAASAGPASE